MRFENDLPSRCPGSYLRMGHDSPVDSDGPQETRPGRSVSSWGEPFSYVLHAIGTVVKSGVK